MWWNYFTKGIQVQIERIFTIYQMHLRQKNLITTSIWLWTKNKTIYPGVLDILNKAILLFKTVSSI